MTVAVPTTKTARRQRIIGLIGGQPVRSQTELAELLAGAGLVVGRREREQVARADQPGERPTVAGERGHDPAQLALMGFGGAGGLHACALAERMRVTRIVVPAACGAFSALGMLCSPRRLDASQGWPVSLGAADVATLESMYAGLEAGNAGHMAGHAFKRQRRDELR